MAAEPHEVFEDALNQERQRRVIKWNAVAVELGVTQQHLLRIRRGVSPLSDDVAVAADAFLGKPRGYTRELTGQPAPAAGIPHEWSADERAQMRSMTLDEAIAFGQKLKDSDGERPAVVWLQEWAKERDRALSPEDSPL